MKDNMHDILNELISELIDDNVDRVIQATILFTCRKLRPDLDSIAILNDLIDGARAHINAGGVDANGSPVHE